MGNVFKISFAFILMFLAGLVLMPWSVLAEEQVCHIEYDLGNKPDQKNIDGDKTSEPTRCCVYEPTWWCASGGNSRMNAGQSCSFGSGKHSYPGTVWTCKLAPEKTDEEALAETTAKAEDTQKQVQTGTEPEPVCPPEVKTEEQPPAQQAQLTPQAQTNLEKGNHTWDPSWDQYVVDTVTDDMISENQLPKAAKADLTKLCPEFFKIPDDQRKMFWAYFFQAVAVPESGLDTTAGYTETTMGKDPITKQKIKSEGLFQLSYQDSLTYGDSCKFDWSSDKSLSGETKKDRTIFDPKKQIECAVGIMRKQLYTRGDILSGKAFYWAVLDTDRRGFKTFNKQFYSGSEYVGPSYCVKK